MNSTFNFSQSNLTRVTNNTTNARDDETGLNAFLYIVVVMLFYAMAMVVLVVKYLRGEKEEANLRRLYKDYIDREDFLEAYMMSERIKSVTQFKQTLSCDSNLETDSSAEKS